jgi:hypothetical protein
MITVRSECTPRDALGGQSCFSTDDDRIVRMDILGDDPPHQIDYYDAATDQLITTVVEPDEGPVSGDGIHWFRRSYLIVDSDGSNARRVDWPFEWARFAEYDGRLFALWNSSSTGYELSVTADLDRWEQLELPGAVEAASLSSDGSTMVLAGEPERDDDGDEFVTNGPVWTTTDGVTWTGWESALTGYWARQPSPTDFGWIGSHDASYGDVDEMTVPPSLAISLEAETWQVVALPVPATLAERGLDWTDARSDDGTIDWVWDVDALGDTIFITLRSDSGDGAQEPWVGQVDIP